MCKGPFSSGRFIIHVYVNTYIYIGPAQGYRFPAYAPHEQDFEPSSDHLSISQNALTYMLIQHVDDINGSVILLPAWPCDWDVEFTRKT